MKIKRFATILSVALVVSGLAVAPGAAPAVQAANTVSYVLFATDAYIQLVDGTVLYNYGFVGGRSTDPVVYQNSMIAPPKAPKTYVPGGLVSTDPANLSGQPAVAPPCRLRGVTECVCETSILRSRPASAYDRRHMGPLSREDYVSRVKIELSRSVASRGGHARPACKFLQVGGGRHRLSSERPRQCAAFL